MNRLLTILLLWASLLAPAFAQKGYNIRIKLDNYPEKDLTLGFHFGEKQYVKDTTILGPDGYFTFSADTLLPCGVYLLVLKPDNSFIQVLVPQDDQAFTLTTDVKDPVNKMKVKGSDDNAVFYEYLQFLNQRRPEADTLRAQLSRVKSGKVDSGTKSTVSDSAKIAEQLNAVDQKVKKYQTDLAARYPKFLSAKIVKASIDPEPPQYPAGDKDAQLKRYYWYRAHFFDNIDLADPCMLRSPVMHSRIDQYITKITPQHPDTVNIALDQLIQRTAGNPETYKYYLIHFLNYYAKSNIVGFDACYVYLAKNYYCKGLAPWTKKEDLDKICDNALRLEPILIGKIAPNIIVKDKKDQPTALWDVDADYTVLFFWDPECGHCKKSAPFMVEFAKNFKDRGVKVFNVCTAVTDKAKECWKNAEEKGFSDEFFINTYDPYVQSAYKTKYDIRTTPQIFILDRKHEILMKRIGAEELGKVMEQVMKFQEEKKKKGK